MSDVASGLKDVVLTQDQRLWLGKAAAAIGSFDPRVAKVHLLGKIATDFNPHLIDPRLYVPDRITLLGLYVVDSKNPIFRALNVVISTVRDFIIESPGIDQVVASEIAERAALDVELVTLVFSYLSELGRFYSGASLSSDGGILQLTGSEDYDEYLRYAGIDALIERVFRARLPHGRSTGSYPLMTLSGDLAFPSGSEPTEVSTVKRNQAFILMAIDPTKPELDDVCNTIKDVCRQFGINAFRADGVEHSDRITDLILNEIRSCEYLIADLTFERPNVYYELGYAHAVGSNPIMYRREGTRVHFDLSTHNIPEYKNNTHLRELLIKRFENMTGRKPGG